MIEKIKMQVCFILFSLLVFTLRDVRGLQDGLHPTPMMGWSSWNTFFEENNEENMKGIADAVKSLGLDTFGYKYLTVDDFGTLQKETPPETCKLTRQGLITLYFFHSISYFITFISFSGFPVV